MKQIITSLLDTDWYKFTMAQAVLQKHPSANVRYEFVCRNKDIMLGGPANEVKEQIARVADLNFEPEELEYLRSLGLPSHFIDFLGSMDLNNVKVDVSGTDEKDQLYISVTGPWIHAIWFEVPILAIVNELYNQNHIDHVGARCSGQGYLERLETKMAFLQEENDLNTTGNYLKFMEFGTRRRYSKEIQEHIVDALRTKLTKNYLGTSNVLLSKKFGTKPLGTMAHEWIQAGQAFTHPLDSQVLMLNEWIDVYGKENNIALIDTLTSDKFFVDFPLVGKKFKGYRQDSGDPYEWTENLLAALADNGEDPLQKTVIYSDSLDFEKAADLFWQYQKMFGSISFGIGTNLTNDVEGWHPLNIVMKLVEVNDRVVAKLSDNPEKAICSSDAYLNYLREEIEYTTMNLVQSREQTEQDEL
jgi:nicotinate phosphoribosyltransferase